MNRTPNPLIEQMAAELQPVRSIRLMDGLVLAVLAALVTVVAIELVQSLWRGAWAGEASAFFLITNGLLLILACASTSSVLRMANPHVGNNREGPKWAMAMLAVLPIAALATLLGRDNPLAAIGEHHGLSCFGAGLAASLLSAAMLTFWLRRGAPVSTSSAGLQVGVASTALGSAAYGLACPLDDMVHLGIWHVAPVLVGALIGRFLLPPLLRW